jgi:hypothetical protein
MQVTGHSLLGVALVGTLCVILFFVSAQLWYPFVLQYRLGRRSVLIMLLGLVPIIWLRYEYIERVQVIRLKEIWGTSGSCLALSGPATAHSRSLVLSSGAEAF